jgi:hypothetical protein
MWAGRLRFPRRTGHLDHRGRPCARSRGELAIRGPWLALFWTAWSPFQAALASGRDSTQLPRTARMIACAGVQHRPRTAEPREMAAGVPVAALRPRRRLRAPGAHRLRQRCGSDAAATHQRYKSQPAARTRRPGRPRAARNIWVPTARPCGLHRGGLATILERTPRRHTSLPGTQWFPNNPWCRKTQRYRRARSHPRSWDPVCASSGPSVRYFVAADRLDACRSRVANRVRGRVDPRSSTPPEAGVFVQTANPRLDGYV